MSNIRKYWNRQTMLPILVTFVLGALVTSAVWWMFLAGAGNVSHHDGSHANVTSEPSSPLIPLPPVSSANCAQGMKVSTTTQLDKALASAKPGTAIVVEPGVYEGNFVASTSGTATEPISVCGTAKSILDGGNTSKGYVFHLDHASYWDLEGFTVRNGQKGVVADGTVGSVISGLTVTDIGDEGIHLRDYSTDNTVKGNSVSNTGLLKGKFGEGIYIGTAKSNWCEITSCKPDNSDRNLIEDNLIQRTTAENIDIKEGTTGGVIQNNSFNGTGMTAAGSWIDVKGNSWIIEGNHGVNSPNDGFQTHEILPGWGTKNIFRGNTGAVNGPGYGIASRPPLDNVVECNNIVTGAARGLSNISCTNG